MKTIKELEKGCIRQWCGEINGTDNKNKIWYCDLCKTEIQTLKEIIKLIKKMKLHNSSDENRSYNLALKELKKVIQGGDVNEETINRS